MQKDLQKLIIEMIQNSSMSFKDIADAVGKPYSTLMRELDPEDRGAKLGVEMLLPLMQACGAVKPLRYLAGAMGYRIVSVKDIKPDKPTFHEELLDTYQALVEYHQAMLAGESLETVAKRREVLIRQVKEDYAFFESSQPPGEDEGRVP